MSAQEYYNSVASNDSNPPQPQYYGQQQYSGSNAQQGSNPQQVIFPMSDYPTPSKHVTNLINSNKAKLRLPRATMVTAIYPPN